LIGVSRLGTKDTPGGWPSTLLGPGTERRVVMLQLFKSFWTDESGQGLAEYAVLITLIAIVLFTAIVLFRDAIINVFTRITSILNSGT
jgi:Flp pilus assembly pilin Flp